MANILLGYNNLIDSATLSGGDWNTGFPLTNLKNRLLSKPARSSNALAASTGFTIDLGAAKPVRAFGAIKTSLSATGASFRLRASDDATFATSLYDAGWQAADTMTPHLIVGLAEVIVARYWRLEIIDTANAAGYVQIGRVFIGDAFAPSDNYSFGAALGYRSRSEMTQSQGGVMYFNRRAGQRQFQFQLDWLNEADAAAALELQRLADITEEVLLIRDREDTVYNQQRHFLGVLTELSPLQNPYVGVHQTAFNVLEVI